MSGDERRWTLHICAECGEMAHGPGSRCLKDRRRTWTLMTTVEVMPVAAHEAALAAARQVDEAMVERAAEAIYMEPDEFHRRRPDGVTWEAMLTYGGHSPGNRDHPLADEYRRIARAALLAAPNAEARP